jgi:multidrug resistance efflux pump
MGAEPNTFRVDAAPSAANPLVILLGLESAAREATTAVELSQIIATDWRKLIKVGQVFACRVKAGQARILAVTGQSSVESTSPLICALQEGLEAQLKAQRGVRARLFAIRDLDVKGAPELADYPFTYFCLKPLTLSNGQIFAAVLLARDTAWTDQDVAMIDRLAGAFAHAWQALEGKRRLSVSPLRRYATPVGAALILLAGLIPAPLTALAPVEVVGLNPDYVSAPIEGVVRRIEVDPNAIVAKGDVLATFVDTTLRGRASVAEQNVLVSQARERRLAQAAFTDRAARRELAVAEAELGLALAESEAAREALGRTVVRAARDGIAVYQNRADIEGKPVATGERLMAVADPAAVEYRIELPVKDAILAREGARVRIYLDADPLSPLDAKLNAVSFHAAPVPGSGLAFVLRAERSDQGAAPRIGFRGTAQIYGDTVPLAYYLLRRPLMMFRQALGL